MRECDSEPVSRARKLLSSEATSVNFQKSVLQIRNTGNNWHNDNTQTSIHLLYQDN